MANARLGRSEHITGWTFIAPALVLLGVFMLYPIIWSLWMSFQVGKGMNISFGGFALSLVVVRPNTPSNELILQTAPLLDQNIKRTKSNMTG